MITNLTNSQKDIVRLAIKIRDEIRTLINDKYNVKFKEFIDFIDQLLYVIENLFRGVYSYCTQSNDVFEENLYKGNVKYII